MNALYAFTGGRHCPPKVKGRFEELYIPRPVHRTARFWSSEKAKVG